MKPVLFGWLCAAVVILCVVIIAEVSLPVLHVATAVHSRSNFLRLIAAGVIVLVVSVFLRQKKKHNKNSSSDIEN